MTLQHDRLRDPCSFVFGMSRDEWVGLRKEWDEALEQIRHLEADKRVCSELLRNQGEIAGDAARLRAENERLRELLTPCRPDTDAQTDPAYPATVNDVLHLLSCYWADFLPDDVELPDEYFAAWERQARPVIERLIGKRD